TGEENARADVLDRAFRQALLDELDRFLKALADHLVENGALDLNVGESAFVGEFGGADGFSGIGGGIAFGDLEGFRFGKWQTGDEVDVVGHVVTTDGDAAGGGDGAIQIERVIGGAAADIDDQCAAFAVFAVQRHLRGGD